MFWPDIKNLKEFYQSPLGGLACRHICSRVHNLWPEVGSGARLPQPENIAGIGYAAPYITPLIEKEKDGVSSYNIFCIMPAAQGAAHWPKTGHNRSVMANENELPFADQELDRVILVHSLEYAKDTKKFMREIWRVLKPGGKLMIVVPNRRGVWAHAEHTPFGHGQPFSCSQVKELLRDSMFQPKSTDTVLFIPPSRYHFVLSFADAWESFGSQFMRPFGGIVIAEAEKQLYAATLKTAKEKNKTLATALDGVD